MTLTTERQQFAEQNEMSLDFVNWFFDEKKESFGNMWFLMAAALWEGWKGRANREAQPVGAGKFVGWGLYHTKSGEFGDWLRSTPMPGESHAIRQGYANVKLYTIPPAPAIPDIGSSVVNDAAWKLHDTLTKYGPLNGHQFNHLKSCLYEALKIVMAAPPAQAAPEKN